MRFFARGIPTRSRLRAVLLGIVVALLGLAPLRAQTAAASPTAKQAATEVAATQGAAKAANGAAPGQPTAPTPATAVRLAFLPAPLPPALTQGIDVEARSRAILAHLNEVIRFYRMTVVPIQKTGEPSDMLYAEQAQRVATQTAQLAFQSARDEAALLARIPSKSGLGGPKALDAESQKLAAFQENVAHQMQDLQAQNETLTRQLASARGSARVAIEQNLEQVQGQLQLAAATTEALSKVSGISRADTGLLGEIDQLQHAAPELVDSKIKPVANTLESIGTLRDAGLSTQAVALFQLIGTSRAIEQRMAETQRLHDQAIELRTPLVKILRATLDAGQQLQNAPPSANGPSLADTRKSYDQLTDAFKAISGVSIPISQEVLLLEQCRGNLLSWSAAVQAERTTILRSVLLRVFAIALALALILGAGEIWRRATARYVQDIRRRRQLLLVRRMVIGSLGGIVLILGFVTQFSSLATFAGFITAGIAVGLQTILLSVAAYFFIIGRYGVRVGDRITVAGVTGDVVEVGLVRFYMMELVGSGTELHPTGRIAVFANSVLFQTGTPLYKQIPGTDYAWHEITVKLKAGTDYQSAVGAVRGAVEAVYSGYKATIEQQHARVESWMDAPLAAPSIEARLQLSDGLEYAVLYPVQIAGAGAADEQIVQGVLHAMAEDQAVTEAIDGPPRVRAVIKT